MMKFINSVTAKIIIDLYYIQMKPTLWYIPIVTAASLILLQFVPGMQENGLNQMSMIYQSSKIFMLVIGIIFCNALLSYYVKNGITRKDYFLGSAIAAAVVAFSIMIISAIITGILQLLGVFSNNSPGGIRLEFIENTSSTWVIPVIALSLILLCYYIAGWTISVGFYRYGNLGGFGFIGIAILFVSIMDLLWEGSLSLPLLASISIPVPYLTVPLSIIGTLILIFLGLWLIRSVTKQMPIKIQ
ncbi:hypothetical protein [Candidatus Contubernalis alkaliaceticus]|uniref:hypothetical protein n=1 Tax=Candidatus Contubernalis alkaliaceticus TaxID=338645 RepID=UPI001F4BE209|nr:hypothetical protein [Candidatus Contubernalis alkalaceticus]UNC93215.1 hypothetical protein HUE98_14635 [Candidatus Contubernalis alkalaceticus]